MSPPSHDNEWTLWPSRARWFTFLRLGLALDLLFLVVYGGANLINGHRTDHFGLYFPWELQLPLVPELVYLYFSIFLMCLLPPFALGIRGLERLAAQLAVTTLVSGAVFLLLPTQLGFERLTGAAETPALLRLLYWVDIPHNLFPSLHIAYSVLIAQAVRPGSPGWFRPALAGWVGLMCVSVVLVHQHHVIDVFGGLLLAGGIGLAWTRFGPDRMMP